MAGDPSPRRITGDFNSRPPLSVSASRFSDRRPRLCRVEPQLCFNAPNWFFVRRRPGAGVRKEADRHSSVAAKPADGVVGADPFREGARRTSKPLAPNRSNLRPTACARQAIVRVPESNTKYGGKWGKPGGQAAPCSAASISESKGIRKRKIFSHGADISPAPALHRASFYSRLGLVLGRLRRSGGRAG